MEPANSRFQDHAVDVKPVSPGTLHTGRGKPVWRGLMVIIAAFLVAPLLSSAVSAQERSAMPAPSSADLSVSASRLVPGARVEALSFAQLKGWRQDDLPAALKVFRAGCPSISRRPADPSVSSSTSMLAGLRVACKAASELGANPGADAARRFFETHFQPFRISPEAGGAGFFTGYYEPEVEGALTRRPGYEVPVLGRPKDLVTNAQGVWRRAGGQLVPYHDRAAIEDGALAGQGLEVAWLKNPVDLFFMQIQGSGRVRLPDGKLLRLNYAAKNGYPYTPVGRILIDEGIVPRDEMSMARIRAFMEQDPQAGQALRRHNRSYVFFTARALGQDAGPLGAQGIPLTTGRSLAVDRRIHTYGVPVFVEAELPLQPDGALTPFNRLMIAQDTGSAIVGPARGDLFFGAGAQAADIAGGIRHAGSFTLLVPRATLSGARP